MKRRMQILAKLDVWIYMTVLVIFVGAAVSFGFYELAAAEGATFLLLLAFAIFNQRRRDKMLDEYIEVTASEAEDAKNNTLKNFPLPVSVFRLTDSVIVWGNESFFALCGNKGARLDAKIADLVPDFSGAWLTEGKNTCPELLTVHNRTYKLHGSLIRPTDGEGKNAVLAMTYWVDVTESEELRAQYESSRIVAGVVIIDNFDEMTKNQPERIKTDIREAVEDKLNQWCESYGGIIRRYDRDRYIVLFEKRNIESMKENKFAVTEEIRHIESPTGIAATISIGFGVDGETMHGTLQFADVAVELALSRGGDQTVIKDRASYEFYGGRGFEVEKRTKVRSRVVANTLTELMRDSSRVIVMGHRFPDLDSVGAAVGICALARKNEVRYNIALDPDNNAAHSLIDRLKNENEYREAFISCEEAKARADMRTLLVIVDTNRPEQIEDGELLAACGRVAVIDHHRIAATYIQNAALGFVEPYASSACELVTELIQEQIEGKELLKCEAEAILSGIVLDTKSFTLRTGDRTFDAASYLRRAGADTVSVKKLLQLDMDDTVARYKIMQSATLYRSIAIAAPEEAQDRIVAAQAADELLNISGVDASIVIFPDGSGNVCASARSIGELNAQILMEKLGGGGNRSAAAVQFKDTELSDAVNRIYEAIDEYMK